MPNDKEIEVLLVEDNPDDAMITMRALHKAKMANEVRWVKDGAEALEYLFYPDGTAKNHQLRLILLDLRMPKVDGLEVLQRLKANPVTKVVPVVVLTSSTQDEDIIKSYDLGVNSFVSKPVNFGKFAETVSHLGLYWLLINKQPNGS